jgi:hypothetical protein
MAKLEHSEIDEAALREWLASNVELANALGEAADEVADKARIHVATHHIRYHGKPYEVKTRVVTGNGDTNPLTAVINAPLGAFLGTDKGLRHQVGAWGHKVDLWHRADDYILRDSADSLWVG